MSLPWRAFAFLAGILCVETREVLTPAALYASPLAAIALATSFLRPAVLVMLAGGAGWAWWHASLLLSGDLAAGLEDRDIVVVGDVVSLPLLAAGRVQFDFVPLLPSGLPPNVRLSWYDATRAPRAAERWQFEVRLRQRRGFANPGGFDYEGQLLRERVGATGYVRASAANRLIGAGESRPILALRARIAERMEAALGSSTASAVLIGLAVGHTSGISSDTWRVFSATGTTHLVAISGLHVTMIATLAMALARAAWGCWPRLRGTRTDVAALAGAGAATGYALLAGFSVPTQRTLAMLVIALCTGMLRRSLPASSVLSLSLLAVLALDPHAVLTPGFWLSFLAVAAILMATRRERGPLAAARTFLGTQAAVTVLLLPVTLALFGSVSLVAPLANLVAIPLFTLILVPATLAGVAVIGVVPIAGEACLRLAARAFDLTWPLLEWAAQAPAALVYPPEPSVLLLIALALSGVASLVVLDGRVRWLSLLLLLPLFLARPVRPPSGTFEVTVLDVGQGLAVLVETRAHTLLYDAGPAFRSGRSAGELVVIPLLHRQGTAVLDMLVVSHEDSDHSGGVADVVRDFEVRATRAGSCRRGDSWTWDDVHFAFLHPGPGERWNDNDGSCVLRVSGPGGSLLLSGDIERAAETWLATHSALDRSDVVVVPHHGSRSSSTQVFVDASHARLAIVSAGYRNRWHFPHETVVARWCASGARVLDTAHWGAVRVRVDARDGVQSPSGYRAEHRRYWHARVAQPPRSLCP